tara:strand:+ start:8 stop:856 length:849 start_codon:yes stop_codon:yes gene_type:complete
MIQFKKHAKMFNQELDQDTKDRIQNTFSMGIMFIKILMASFPMLFVPQQCDGEPCSMSEKMLGWGWLSLVNVITFASFIGLYFFQGKREHFLIEYLDEDDNVAENKLTTQILEYPIIRAGLLELNKNIMYTNMLCIFMFIINTVYSSCFILIKRYLDSTTITVLLTNSLLVQGKLMQIRQSYTGDDLGVSTVATSPKVYNVIDKDHIRPINEKALLNIISPRISDEALIRLDKKGNEIKDLDTSSRGSVSDMDNSTKGTKEETVTEDIEEPKEPEKPELVTQ